MKYFNLASGAGSCETFTYLGQGRSRADHCSLSVSAEAFPRCFSLLPNLRDFLCRLKSSVPSYDNILTQVVTVAETLLRRAYHVVPGGCVPRAKKNEKFGQAPSCLGDKDLKQKLVFFSRTSSPPQMDLGSSSHDFQLLTVSVFCARKSHSLANWQRHSTGSRRAAILKKFFREGKHFSVAPIRNKVEDLREAT